MESPRIITVAAPAGHHLHNVVVPNVAFDLVRFTGERVLVIDMDPSLDTTRVLIDHVQVSTGRSSAEFVAGADLGDVVYTSRAIEGVKKPGAQGGPPAFVSELLGVVPASAALRGIEAEWFAGGFPRGHAMIEHVYRELRGSDYPWVLIAAPTTGGALGALADVVADGIVAPLRVSAPNWTDGLGSMFYGQFLASTTWPLRTEPLRFLGVLPTDYDSRVKELRGRVDELAGTRIVDLLGGFGTAENRDAMLRFFGDRKVPVFNNGLRRANYTWVAEHHRLLWEEVVMSGDRSPTSHTSQIKLRAMVRELSLRSSS